MGSSLIKVENIGIEEAMELLLLENEEVDAIPIIV
jgi:hypothetical protein